MSENPLDFQRRQLRTRRRRFKRLLGLALILTLAVIFVALWKSGRRGNTTVTASVPLPRNVTRRLSGYTFTRSESGLPIFRIHAARTQSYNGGTSTVLEDVDVTIFGRGKSRRHDEIQTGRCDYDNASGALVCFGRASITLESQPHMAPAPDFRAAQPLFLETSDVSYNPKHFLVETDAPVHFRFGPATGSAKGLRYSTREGWIELEKDVALKSPLNGAESHLSAGALFYDKAANEVEMRSPVEFTQGSRHLSASTGKILLDSQNRARQATLSGGVEGSERLPGETVRGKAESVMAELDPTTGLVADLTAVGSVNFQTHAMADGDTRTLSAQQAQLHFSSSTHRPESGSASGNFDLVSEAFEPARKASSPRASRRGADFEKRTLSGSELRFNFRPNGLLAGAKTVGPGHLELIPLSPKVGRRTLTAGQILLAFDQLGRLQNLRGLSGTHILDQPAGRGEPRESTAEALEARIDSSTGTVRSIQQEGHFQFREGDRQASAQKAVYDESSQRLSLEGNPQLWEPDSRIRATHILMNVDRGWAEGWDHVQSIHFSDAAEGRKTLARDSSSDSPVIVLADKVIVDKQENTARYEGNVRAWQGADVVESYSLDINRKTQRITSGNGVTTLLLEPAPHPAEEHARRDQREPAGTQPVSIHANRLVYLNLGREAVYQGHVRMSSGSTTIQCQRLKVYFSKASGAAGAEVERAVATGGVEIAQLPDRRGHAERAEYFGTPGKVVLTGGSPVIYDAQHGLLTGNRLTFFIHDASLFADGGKKSQTLSKRHIPPQ
ncbi:MAG: LptA/OstA family protein [Terriglobia bacterium]